MNRKLSYFLIAVGLVIALFIPVAAQLGIGTNNPDPSAALDIVSTTQGVLHPRLTTAQRDAISSPAEGLTIYNTTDKCLQVWDGAAWKCAVGSSSSGSSGNSGGAVPQNTMASFPLLSVAASPPVELGQYLPSYPNFTTVRDMLWAMGWIDDQRFVFTHIERSTTVGLAGGKLVVRIYDARLREIATYQYTQPYQPRAVFGDSNGNLVIILSGIHPQAGSAIEAYFMVLDPDNGSIVKAVTAVETPTPLYNLESRYGTATRLADGTIVVLKYFASNVDRPEKGLYRIESNYAVTGVGFQEATFAYKQRLLPTSFGYLRLAVGLNDNSLQYSAHNADGTVRKALAPVTTDSNSLFYRPRDLYSALVDDDILYLLATNTHVQPNTPRISKWTVDSSGALTAVWDTALPLSAAYLGDTTNHPSASAIMEMNPDGNLMINLAPVANTPTGFFQDGTLYMNGIFLPIAYVNPATGAVAKSVSIDSAAVRTHWGEGRADRMAQDDLYSDQLLVSPSGQHMVYYTWHRVYAPNGTTFLGDWWHLSALDPATLASVYALSNDGVAHPLAKRFMVYDFNENISKVEIRITNGLLGDLLDINNDTTLPSGMSKAYSFSQKKLTITGGATNTAAQYKTVLNGLTFATDAGTGERTLEAKIFDGDGNTNTTTFTIQVAN